MTSTSKSTRIRDVAVGTGGNLVQAAKIFGTGTAGISATLASKGYTLARNEIERRKKIEKRKRSTPRISRRTRRIVVFGTLFGAAAGAAILATKRRRTVQPPAERPPSLADYTEDTAESPNGRVVVPEAPQP